MVSSLHQHSSKTDPDSLNEARMNEVKMEEVSTTSKASQTLQAISDRPLPMTASSLLLLTLPNEPSQTHKELFTKSTSIKLMLSIMLLF